MAFELNQWKYVNTFLWIPSCLLYPRPRPVETHIQVCMCYKHLWQKKLNVRHHWSSQNPVCHPFHEQQGLGIVLVGTLLQFHSHFLLAQPWQKRRRTAPASISYRIPRGGGFEWVSCPHYLAEILVYVGFAVLLVEYSVWPWLPVAWVFANLTLAAGLTHGWYLHKFKTYPRHRKALIPYIYWESNVDCSVFVLSMSGFQECSACMCMWELRMQLSFLADYLIVCDSIFSFPVSWKEKKETSQC